MPQKDPNCPFLSREPSMRPRLRYANRREGTPRTRLIRSECAQQVPGSRSPPPEANVDEAWRIPPLPDTLEGTLYWQASGVGCHEVLIESPTHNGSLGSYSAAQMERILGAIKERFAAIYDTKDIAYVQVFKNSGKTAGASLTHPNFQIIGLPVMPPAILWEGQRLKDYESKTRRCLICDLLEREAEKDVRVVLRNDRFIVLSPFAQGALTKPSLCPRSMSQDSAR